MSLFNNGINLLENGTRFEVVGDRFVKSSLFQRLNRVIFKSAEIIAIQQIAEFTIKKLEQEADNESALSFSRFFIAKYKDGSTSKVIQSFETHVTPHQSEPKFQHAQNFALYRKWERNGFPLPILFHHPEFAQFLDSSGILSQMKVTKDFPKEIHGEPALLVEGKWMTWTEIQKQFTVMPSPVYYEKFVVSKDTLGVYTYLGNGKGLQKHHPYITEQTPIAVLSDEEYETLHALANQFQRTSDLNGEGASAPRNFILQIVSSYVEGSKIPILDLLRNRKHPYLRLIIGQDNPERNTKKGEVYEVGFGWKKKNAIPFAASQGQFRSPDIWEYQPCDQRVVTNIAITQEEARRFTEFTLRYHHLNTQVGFPIGFHLARQNCSSYVRAALEATGIEAPTEVGLEELTQRIIPLWLQKGYSGTKASLNAFTNRITKMTKELSLVQKIVAFMKKFSFAVIKGYLAFALVPVNVALGGTTGNGGVAFTQANDKGKTIKPSLASWKRWFTLSSYRFNLPGILQEWQLKQASTQVFKKPVKLAIV